MKQLFTVVLLASVAIAARSQEPKPQLRQLEQFIQEQGYAVSHTQSTGTERGISHQWSALLTAYIIHPQSASKASPSPSEGGDVRSHDTNRESVSLSNQTPPPKEGVFG